MSSGMATCYSVGMTTNDTKGMSIPVWAALTAALLALSAIGYVADGLAGLALGGIASLGLLALVIERIVNWRRSRQERPGEPTATEPASDGTRWRVQGFLLPAVTGQDKDIPYAPIFLDSEQAAREKFTRLYRDHGPGMVRVEIEQLDVDQ